MVVWAGRGAHARRQPLAERGRRSAEDAVAERQGALVRRFPRKHQDGRFEGSSSWDARAGGRLDGIVRGGKGSLHRNEKFSWP